MLLRMVSVSAIVLSTITIPAVTASADVVDAMSRDFGITQAQALTRIRAEKVALMVGTSVCAEPGDSGGSFITGDQAQGVTSGGYGNCSSGGRTWFQPVNEILRVYGLTLLTA